MNSADSHTPTIPTPDGGSERLEMARDLYRRYHAQCFWNSPLDLHISEGLIPFVAKGLRTNGGRRGFLLAGKLQGHASTRESPECR